MRRLGAQRGLANPRRPGWLLEAAGNGSPRGMAVAHGAHNAPCRTEPGLQAGWHLFPRVAARKRQAQLSRPEAWASMVYTLPLSDPR